ncbi:MAG: SRPBCC family protein [Nitriliruptorales bacterium]|nr:SRPBCC family protein [Nitriliruptorales bacterium]
MPTIEQSITIDRPRDEVFAFATDPDKITLFNSNLVEYEQQSEGARGKGTVDRGTVKVAGKKFDFTTEITEWQPGQRMTARSLEAPMEWELTQIFEDTGSGTEVTFHQEVPDLKGFFGKLGDAIVTKMYSRDVKSNLESLKILLEEG